MVQLEEKEKMIPLPCNCNSILQDMLTRIMLIPISSDSSMSRIAEYHDCLVHNHNEYSISRWPLLSDRSMEIRARVNDEGGYVYRGTMEGFLHFLATSRNTSPI